MVKVNIHEHYTRVTRFSPLLACKHRGGSRGRVQGVRTPLPPPPEMTCGFLIQLVFCKKKNYVVYWC